MADSLNIASPEEKFKITDFQTLSSDIINANSTLSNLFPNCEEFNFDSSSNLYYLKPSLTDPTVRGLYRLESTDFSNDNGPIEVFDISCTTNIDRRLSSEQELIHERKRLQPHSTGIDSYTIDESSGKYLFTAGSELLIGEYSDETKRIISSSLPIKHTVNAEFCIGDTNIIGYVRNSNVYIYSIRTDQEFCISNVTDEAIESGISAGLPSFSVQEDMDRYTSLWWRPCSKPMSDIYYMMYEVVDDREINTTPIINPITSHITYQRYPIPDGPISKSDLIIAEITLKRCDDSNTLSIDVKLSKLYTPLYNIIGGADYLCRAGWMKDSIWVELINRAQTQKRIIEIPIDCFKTNEEWTELYSTDNTNTTNSLKLSKLILLFYEENEYWINVNHLFTIINTSPNVLQIIVSSEVKYQHLYLLTYDRSNTNKCNILQCNGNYSMLDFTSLNKITPITYGEWKVNGKHLWVNDKYKLIYYMATSVTPLELHLHVSSYANNSSYKVLTELGYFHDCVIDTQCCYAVVTSSNLKTSPCIKLYGIQNNEDVTSVALTLLRVMNDSAPLPKQFISMDIFQFKNSRGDELYSMHALPNGAVHGNVYPLFVYIYGGTMTHLVTNQFSFIQLKLQLFLNQGFSVLVTDGSGVNNRSIQFEGIVKHKMGQLEISDQVDAIQHIQNMTSSIDMERICIHGWSYGGYASFLSLAQRPDIFRIAICGGTVQDWSIYESAYTEKFMGTPTTNPKGYELGCCEYYVNNMPKESGRLLFIHGEIDENVHFRHVQKLISCLITHGVPYMLNVFPTERHGVRQRHGRLHLNATIFSFLKEHLQSTSLINIH